MSNKSRLDLPVLTFPPNCQALFTAQMKNLSDHNRWHALSMIIDTSRQHLFLYKQGVAENNQSYAGEASSTLVDFIMIADELFVKVDAGNNVSINKIREIYNELINALGPNWSCIQGKDRIHGNRQIINALVKKMNETERSIKQKESFKKAIKHDINF